MSYEIQIDREVKVGDKIYSVFIEAELDYSHAEDPEPTGVEITKAEIALLDGDNLQLGYDGQTIEKIVVAGNSELTEAIDKILWDEIQTYTEDNYQDLIRDLGDAADERDL